MADAIRLRGVRTHNLKNINVSLPRDQLVVITGLSGSGKSSLAFDTLYAEGQRRYVESLSTYARQFLSMMEKPDVDLIEGLSPAIAIEQKSVSHNPRSTVGTTTEIYDYLRLLYARVGTPRCPTHDLELNAQPVSQMVDTVLAMPEGSKIMILAPVVQARKGEHTLLFEQLQKQGFTRARVDGHIHSLDYTPELDGKKKHDIEVVVDRLKVRADIQQRLAESFETALRLANGLAAISLIDEPDNPQIFSSRYACSKCDYSAPNLEPRLFSFNNPVGACSSCDGLGARRSFDRARIIHDPSLSIGAGAICGWDKRNGGHYFNMLKNVLEHYQLSVDTPFEQLSDDMQQTLLYGSGRTKIQMSRKTSRGRTVTRNRSFPGIIPYLEKRYSETESTAVREELTKYLTHTSCPTCQGTRLCEAARHVFVGKINLPSVNGMAIETALAHFDKLRIPGHHGEVAQRILREISSRLQFLMSVGLNYLTLDRTAETLSGGESQRIRLASQIGSGLVGVMYILDEPSIGLHQRDNSRLLATLNTLRDLGNTVIVVEHDEEAIRSADHVIDIGPGAGVHGGKVLVQGSPAEVEQHRTSLTGQYLRGSKKIAVPKKRHAADPQRQIEILGACRNNLQQVDAAIPLGLMTCITGVSGSGKSSLINDTLLPIALHELNRASAPSAGTCKAVSGLDQLDKTVAINQSPIGRTPRSNPATYTGLLTPIRELFAGTPEARTRGYQAGRFSFNVRGGRCEACEGGGLIKVEMHFLADMYVTCDTCQGMRYNRETLEITYKSKNIHQVLDMTIEDAFEFFSAIPVLKRKLQTLLDVGLGYIKLGQSATTLSGGEAQRIKLSRELSKRATGRTLYVLDEPTTGLHFHDVNQLLEVLHRLRDQGNTVVVIEHNLDVIKTADWLIDLGPEGGSGGGQIIATGTPEAVATVKASFTGQYLKDLLR